MKKNNVNHADRDHAILSPSSMKTASICIGGIYMSKDIEEVPSPYAEEGTKAHEIAEYHVGRQFKLKTPAIRVKDYDADMALYGKAYADYLQDTLNEILEDYPPPVTVTHYVENRVGFSDLIWGTPDYYCIIEIPLLEEVIMFFSDYKYGMGVKVDAEDNEQIKTYCACVAKDYYEKTGKKVQTFHTSIYQPRVDEDNPASYYLYTFDEIVSWGREIKRLEKHYKSIKTDEDALDLLSAEGLDHCRFCKFKTMCPEFKKETESKSLVVLTDAEPLIPDPTTLTTEQLVNIFKVKKPMETYLSDVEHLLLQRGLKGEDIGDLKVVEGQTRRSWIKDEKLVHDVLKANGCKRAYRKSLITLGEAEKQIKNGKEVLAEVTTMSIAKKQLTTKDDKRPEILGTKALDLLTTLN